MLLLPSITFLADLDGSYLCFHLLRSVGIDEDLLYDESGTCFLLNQPNQSVTQ